MRVALALLAAVILSGIQSDPLAARELRTAVMDPAAFAGPQAATAFEGARAGGAGAARLVLVWSQIAAAEPSGDRADPANPAYRWSAFDDQVRKARASGLDPIVCVTHAPAWARDIRAGDIGSTWPIATELALFMRAAAERYGGSFSATPETAPLPAVRAWQVWNEPNAHSHLRPQFRGSVALTPARYRSLVNAAADQIHAAHPDNHVVAGGLGPFGHRSKDIQVVAPMRFMSEMLCVSIRPPHRRTCRARSTFDVWSHHPYTNGGPTRKARSPDDASIGDLPEMRRLLTAAIRAGNVVSTRRVEFWVTEFSWDTRPSDPKGVPMTLHGRWVAEALYRMWQSGVSLVTWFRIRDDPLRESPYQSGMYFAGGAPKPSLRAFRFPFVAFADGGGVSIWGRTAASKVAQVILERRRGNSWAQLRGLRTDRYGIFQARIGGPMQGSLRARLADGSDVSVPFSLRRPVDRAIYPFGCGGSIRC